MDWTAIGTGVVSGVLGIGAVSLFLSKTLPKILKYVNVANDALKLAKDAITALEDKSVTPEEIVLLKADYEQIKADLKP